MDVAIKKELFNFCMNYLQQREKTIRDAIAAAQAAGNEETKSSAGDKYETTRSMMQLEIEQNNAHLAEVLKLRQALESLSTAPSLSTVQAGSVVVTDNGNFYLSIAAGSCTIGTQTFVTLSPASPLGSAMKGLKSGEPFLFRGKNFRILDVM